MISVWCGERSSVEVSVLRRTVWRTRKEGCNFCLMAFESWEVMILTCDSESWTWQENIYCSGMQYVESWTGSKITHAARSEPAGGGKRENQESSTTKTRTTTGAKQDRQRLGVANERQHVFDSWYSVTSRVIHGLQSIVTISLLY